MGKATKYKKKISKAWQEQADLEKSAIVIMATAAAKRRHREALGAVRTLLRYMGDNPRREGLQETPERFLKAMRAMTAGMSQDPYKVVKMFEATPSRTNPDDDEHVYSQMIFQPGIPVYSTCVVGSTFVETPKGRVPIKWLKDGDWVYTVTPSTMELGLVRCKNPRITQRNAKLVRVISDNDTIICTPNHKFLLTSGAWVKAEDLKNNDRVVSLYRAVHQVKGGAAYPTLVSTRWQRKVREGRLLIHGQSKNEAEHRYVARAANIPQCTKQHVIIHHKNELVWDASPENLACVSVAEHNRLHDRTAAFTGNEKRKRRAAESSGRPEVRAKRAASVRAAWAAMTPAQHATRRANMKAGIVRNHTIIGVEPLEHREDVWCMDVPGTHTFFANGMAVHNCEHHLLPFFGVARVGYIPSRRGIVGLSKLFRVVDIFAKRLQVQERMTSQIADAIANCIGGIGCGVMLQCRHMCMECRGVRVAGTVTETTELRGVFLEQPTAKEEFLAACRAHTKV